MNLCGRRAGTKIKSPTLIGMILSPSFSSTKNSPLPCATIYISSCSCGFCGSGFGGAYSLTCIAGLRKISCENSSVFCARFSAAVS